MRILKVIVELLVCPRCKTTNEHRAIEFDVEHETCYCTTCSMMGNVGNFLPKESVQ